ncbi:hypothetical protein Vadar_011215 [Vaccinium darrowii]|uniref:Uncharacterized protein n=1 Tax=Vaccinium darrowii TaxID=229202 RepID=A0ACB7XI16_9ERIC|nr:hypothetical protein Vadar_011215 [Vaccinium darrowii]
MGTDSSSAESFAWLSWVKFKLRKQIHFLILFSRQGKVRLTKWYSPYSQKERTKVLLSCNFNFLIAVTHQLLEIAVHDKCKLAQKILSSRDFIVPSNFSIRIACKATLSTQQGEATMGTNCKYARSVLIGASTPSIVLIQYMLALTGALTASFVGSFAWSVGDLVAVSGMIADCIGICW